jgi:hypothetical protein
MRHLLRRYSARSRHFGIVRGLRLAEAFACSTQQRRPLRASISRASTVSLPQRWGMPHQDLWISPTRLPRFAAFLADQHGRNGHQISDCLPGVCRWQTASSAA